MPFRGIARDSRAGDRPAEVDPWQAAPRAASPCRPAIFDEFRMYRHEPTDGAKWGRGEVVVVPGLWPIATDAQRAARHECAHTVAERWMWKPQPHRCAI